jgi:sulfite exporter TauE/SafE
MTTFLTIIVVMLFTSILIVALLCGGIDMLYEKIEKEKKNKR